MKRKPIMCGKSMYCVTFLLAIALVNSKDIEVVEVNASPSATSRGALGQGFNIHKEDLLTKQFKASGSQIFQDLPIDECTTNDKLGTIEKDDTYYKSTESLYRAVSTNTKVEGSLKGPYTLGASVEAVTNNINTEKTEVQGLSLNLKSFGMSSELKKTCVNNKPLNPNLAKDFEALDSVIESPWLKSSWRGYTAFLTKYGSHVVSESISGSSIYQYVFARSEQNFSQRDLTVKACLSLSGVTQAGQASVSACNDVSEKEIQEAASKDMTQKLVVRGGKVNTRASLTGKLTPEQIEKFLIEGTTDPSPIEYKFIAIWEILKTRYTQTEHLAKVFNLEQFYKGFLHFKCNYDSVETVSRNKVIAFQAFRLTRDSNPAAPTYECRLGPKGCHDDGDCYFIKSKLSCGCGGPRPERRDNSKTCIRYREEELLSGTTKLVAYANHEHRWRGGGCSLSGFHCKCTDERTNGRASWSGEQLDTALKDVHIKMMEEKQREKARRNQISSRRYTKQDLVKYAEYRL